jgi:hypothetical protein
VHVRVLIATTLVIDFRHEPILIEDAAGCEAFFPESYVQEYQYHTAVFRLASGWSDEISSLLIPLIYTLEPLHSCYVDGLASISKLGDTCD